MARPKLNVGDVILVKTLYESTNHKHCDFKIGDHGIVVKILGDIVHLDVDGKIKKINIYNIKKKRKK